VSNPWRSFAGVRDGKPSDLAVRVPRVSEDLVNGLLWWFTERATVGLVVRDGTVVEAPPYARRWAKGRAALELYREGERNEAVTVAWIPEGS